MTHDKKALARIGVALATALTAIAVAPTASAYSSTGNFGSFRLDSCDVTSGATTTITLHMSWSVDGAKPTKIGALQSGWGAVPVVSRRVTHAELVSGTADLTMTPNAGTGNGGTGKVYALLENRNGGITSAGTQGSGGYCAGWPIP